MKEKYSYLKIFVWGWVISLSLGWVVQASAQGGQLNVFPENTVIEQSVQVALQKNIQPSPPAEVKVPVVKPQPITTVSKPSAPIAKTPAPAKTVANTVKTVAPAATVSKAPVAVARKGVSYVVKSTAYNSLPSQTDSTPHITATGMRTRFGIIALSRDMLRKIPYGSKVLIEDLGAYGSGRGSGVYNRMLSQTIFVVADTMHVRKSNQADIWMSSRSQAKYWGVRQIRITVLK